MDSDDINEQLQKDLLTWVNDTYGSIEQILDLKQVPPAFQLPIKDVLIERSKYGLWLGKDEIRFQQTAIQIFQKHGLSLAVIKSAYIMVIDIARLWRDSQH